MSAPKYNYITETLPSGLTFEMVKVEGDSFEMGSEDGMWSQPVHKVIVPSFYIGKHLVTNKEFAPFLNEMGNQKEGGEDWVNLEVENRYSIIRCGIKKTGSHFSCVPGLEDYPMVYVSWYGAEVYAKWLSQKTDKVYRLPSEAEWEYAAKGGRKSLQLAYSGSNKLKEVAWFNKNSLDSTHRTGQKLPNELGIYDMSGNVWEWCADHWVDDYNNTPRDGSAWISGNDSGLRVVRGGSWYFVNNFCRPDFRYYFYSNDWINNFGFRLARY